MRPDRLWYFTGVSRIESKITPTGSPTTRDLERDNVLGKLTWQANDRWQVMGRYVADRPLVLNANASRFTSAEAASRRDGDTSIYSTEVMGRTGSRFEWRLTLSRSRGASRLTPMSGDIETSGHVDIGLGYAASVNSSSLSYSRRERDEASGSFAWFSGHGGSDHEIRFGVDFADVGHVRQSNLTGGGVYYDRFGAPSRYLVRPFAAPSPTSGALLTAWLQDTWRPTYDVTVKFGLRRDAVTFDNDVGDEIASLARLQPRFGVVWDVLGNGRLALRASWGHFMHPSALSLTSYLRVLTTPWNYYLSCSENAQGLLGVAARGRADALPRTAPVRDRRPPGVLSRGDRRYEQSVELVTAGRGKNPRAVRNPLQASLNRVPVGMVAGWVVPPSFRRGARLRIQAVLDVLESVARKREHEDQRFGANGTNGVSGVGRNVDDRPRANLLPEVLDFDVSPAADHVVRLLGLVVVR